MSSCTCFIFKAKATCPCPPPKQTSLQSPTVRLRMERSEMSSYPPPFRQTHPPLEEPPSFDEVLKGYPIQHTLEGGDDDDDVPVIDLQDPDLQTLNEASRDWGVFRLINHGIPQKLSDRVWSYAKDLFSLPFESKQTHFSTHPITYFWGTPALQQSVLNLNRVEGFHAPLANLLLQQQQVMLESFR